jgi:SAM-dependent methyltransferase
MDTDTSLPWEERTPEPPKGGRKSLASRFFERAGKFADKWEQYLSIYDVELAPFLARGTPVRLLEIGVQNGGSLELWSEILPAGSRVVGVDCDPNVGALRFENPNISVIIQDATDAEAMRPVLGETLFDLIVDDGSHVCRDVITAFNLYFEYLAPGGKFVIEDLHTSYFPQHGGGLRDPASSVEWLKRLIDVLNFDHIQPNEKLSDLERLCMRRLNAQIGRVSFYDSVAVIEKLPVEKARPYRRVCSGTATDVVFPLFFGSPGALDSILFAHPTARHVEAALVRELMERQSTIDRLQAELAAAALEHQVAQEAAAAREAALAAKIESLGASAEPSPNWPDGDDVADLCDHVIAVAAG